MSHLMLMSVVAKRQQTHEHELAQAFFTVLVYVWSVCYITTSFNSLDYF